MIDDCMQQHIHSTIASFRRTKGTVRRERERERERRRKEGSREDGWKAQTWKNVIQLHDVNDIKNAFIRQDGGGWMGSSYP